MKPWLTALLGILAIVGFAVLSSWAIWYMVGNHILDYFAAQVNPRGY